MFIYPAIKHYKAIWRAEDRAPSGRLKSVRAEAAIKRVRERIRRNPLWKQKIMSRKLNTLTQSSRVSLEQKLFLKKLRVTSPPFYAQYYFPVRLEILT
jgi:hypothetical protein